MKFDVQVPIKRATGWQMFRIEADTAEEALAMMHSGAGGDAEIAEAA